MLAAGGEVGHCCVGLREACFEGGGGGGGGGGVVGLLLLVAGEVDGAEGVVLLVVVVVVLLLLGGCDAVELGVYEGGELGCYGGREEGVVRVGRVAGAFHGYEGFGGGSLGGGGLWVDVWVGVGEVSFGVEDRRTGGGAREGLQGRDSWTVVMEGMMGVVVCGGWYGLVCMGWDDWASIY